MFIALSLFLPYFIGLGFLVFFLSSPTINNSSKTYQEVARFIATNILLGISLNHLLMLLVHNMKISLFIGVIFSITGFCRAFSITRDSLRNCFILGWVIGAISLLTILLFSILILNIPIEWDAQYIWFFHGKMIFYNNGLNLATGLSNPAYQFSHVDYPKLIAILSAQFAYLIGYWNDFLPRLSLLSLLVPAILGVCSFYTKLNISFAYLYLMIFFSMNEYTVNGYMDAYHAIFACLSLLFLWRGYKSDNPEDMLAGFAFVSIIPLLKNEGMLFLVSIIISFILFTLTYKNKKVISMMIKKTIFWYTSSLMLLNIFVWSWIKYKWGLSNDLNLSTDSIQLIINRIHDGSSTEILRHLFNQTNIGISLALLLITIHFSIKLRAFSFNSIFICASVASIYFFGICIIYMSTPHDLSWHLTSSAYRTMMTVNLSIIAANYIVLTTIDNT